MTTDELKMILDLFGQVTDGALIGGIIYFVMQLVGTTVPWIGGYLLLKLILNKVPNFDIEVKEK
jgi:hypothetical protein